MTSPSFRQTRRAIYAAKRSVGQRVIVCRPTNLSLDIATGNQGNDLVKVDVRRAVILQASTLRAFAYDLSFIAANKNFTEGGFYDAKSRVVMVSRRDLPSSFIVDDNVYLMVKGKRYEVKKFVEYEDEEVVLFLLDGLENPIPLDQFVESGEDALDLGSAVVDS